MPDSLASKLRPRAGALSATTETPVTVSFGDWLPDQPAYPSPGALVCQNVIPGTAPGSYKPAKDLTKVSSNALNGPALGGIVARDKDNNVFPYAGTASKLYELVGNTWNDESKAGDYSTGAEDVWEFAVWDRDQKIIATNFADPVQALDIGGGASGQFADLITSTNKPQAKHIDIVRDFVVLGHTDDTTDGVRPNRLWWSAIGDETNFDPSATTQSDLSDLPTGGWVQRVVGGAEYGVIFQESLIRRMEYVGSPVVFDIPAADRKRGTPIPGSVISRGRIIYYISEEGFFEFNGSASTPIGNSRVDNEFWRVFDISNKFKVSAAIDLVNKLVCWGFPVSGDTPNRIYCYKWDTGRWSEIRDVEFDLLLDGQNQGFTLDGLDAVSTNIDTLSPSLDSDAWKGGKTYSGAFTTDHFLASFDGDTLRAIIETGERQLTPGRSSRISDLRPLVEIDENAASSTTGFDIQVAVSQRTRLDVTPTVIGPITVNASGEASIDSQARYQRMTTIIPAGTPWRHARGIVAYKAARGRHDGYSVA